MNIFCTDSCPIESARTAPDKLVIKMPTESGQLLATAFPLSRLAAEDCPRTKTGNPRSHFNPNHPCGVWTRKTYGNFNWLILHSYALLEEKYIRYPHGGRHFAHDFIDWVDNNKREAFTTYDDTITEFPCCINQNSICRTKVPDFDSLPVVDQYKYFIKYDKASYSSWIANRPEWLDQLVY
jgi:hypothetical protein